MRLTRAPSLSCLSAKGVGNAAHPEEPTPPSASAHYSMRKNGESAQFSRFIKGAAAIPAHSSWPLDLRITAGLPSSDRHHEIAMESVFIPAEESLSQSDEELLCLSNLSSLLKCFNVPNPQGLKKANTQWQKHLPDPSHPAGFPSCCPSRPSPLQLSPFRGQ